MAVKFSQGACEALCGRQALKIAAASATCTFSLAVNAGSDSTLTSSNTSEVNFVTLGFKPGDKLSIRRSTTAANNTDGLRIKTVAAAVITLDGAIADTDDTTSQVLIAMATSGGSLADLFNGGTLRLFKGTQPATPNVASSASDLLCEFTDLTFGAPAWDSANARAYIDLYATASATASASGTVSNFRLCAKYGDMYTTSTSEIRMDGSVGSSGDLAVPVSSITNGAPQAIPSFRLYVYQVSPYSL